MVMPSVVVCTAMIAWVRSCRFVTHAGNARSFPLRSLEIIIVAAADAYACFRVGDDSRMPCWGADMPAYIHHHDAEPAFMTCPSCARLPMYIKNVEMSRSLLNIAKRPLPRLTLRGVGLTSKDAVS